ncbi:MAG: ribokinase [Lawsonibacter sp.]|nr:ribokinase [Lawsonibacter sp.]
MARILSYGSLNLDYVYHVPHFVAPGETLFSTARDLNCGGKGLNQSVAAARAGGTVFHAGKMGRDGQLLADMLSSSGVDLSLLSVGDGPSGHAIIQVEPGGQNCILLYGGSNREITRQEIDQALERFGPGDYLMLQNEINGLDYLMERAAQKGISIVFNPSPIDETIVHLPLQRVSLLVFNEIEGAALSGCTEGEAMLDTLRRRWPECRLLLTLGSRGCIYDDGIRRLCHSAYQVTAVDTTAAGDTFTGYFVACLANGIEPEACLMLASRAAAIAVSRPGAAPAIPTMDEVRKFAAVTPD